MTVNKNILFLPGDGIGPEVCEEAKKVLLSVNELFGLDFKVSEELVGGVAFEKTGNPAIPSIKYNPIVANPIL